ncbi:MAG TPA: hypothetical protein VFS97_13815 [Nitrososphaeraceae archaeon]|nr:hypothetical protein [Nitrososphaeraceae archaeon]
MSRKLAIFLFWLLGFSIGFIGYLSLPGLTGWLSTALPNFLNQSVVGALIAGIVGSALSTITVLSWANRTS